MSNGNPYRSDGFISVPRGMDGGRSASNIGADQVARAVNCTFRGEHPAQRPGWIYRTVMPEVTGAFQRAAFYTSDVGNNHLLCVIGGHFYRIMVLQDWTISELSAVDANPINRTYGWWCQAENYTIFQDGISIPLIYDGSVIRRSAENEIKTGTVMAYSFGRIWYATAEGFSFRATDLVRGPSGTIGCRYRDSVLKETENTYLNEGGDFSVPSTSGGIKAMVVPAMLDTSLGQGPLQVFTPTKVFSVNAPIDRTTWKDITYPIQTESQISYGATGDACAIVVNGDILYRAPDGIRSFRIARSDFNSWGNTPISRELRQVLAADQDSLLYAGSAALFDNRVFFTCGPVYHRNGIYHRSLAVMNFDGVGTMLQRDPPMWEGIWCGLKILQIVKGTFAGVERCFLFARNSLGRVEIWEMSKAGLWDEYGVHKNRVAWEFDTPSYAFQNRFLRKKLQTGQIFVDNINGRTSFEIQYKPDKYPCFVDWHRWSDCATVEQCTLTGDCPNPPKDFKPQYRPRITLPQPKDDCNATVGMYFREFYEAQFRFKVRGPARVLQARFLTTELPEPKYGECRGDEPCSELDACCPDVCDYESDSGVYPVGYPEGTVAEDTNPETPDAADVVPEMPPGGNSGALTEPTTPEPELPETPELPTPTPENPAWPGDIQLPQTYAENGKTQTTDHAAYGLLPFVNLEDNITDDITDFCKHRLAETLIAINESWATQGYQLVSIGNPYWFYTDVCGSHANALADYQGVPGQYYYGCYGWWLVSDLVLQQI